MQIKPLQLVGQAAEFNLASSSPSLSPCQSSGNHSWMSKRLWCFFKLGQPGSDKLLFFVKFSPPDYSLIAILWILLTSSNPKPLPFLSYSYILISYFKSIIFFLYFQANYNLWNLICIQIMLKKCHSHILISGMKISCFLWCNFLIQ